MQAMSGQYACVHALHLINTGCLVLLLKSISNYLRGPLFCVRVCEWGFECSNWSGTMGLRLVSGRVSEQTHSRMSWHGTVVARAGPGCVSPRVRPQEEMAPGRTGGVLVSCWREQGSLWTRPVCVCLSVSLRVRMGGARKLPESWREVCVWRCVCACQGVCTGSSSRAAGLRDSYSQVPAPEEAKIHGQATGQTECLSLGTGGVRIYMCTYFSLMDLHPDQAVGVQGETVGAVCVPVGAERVYVGICALAVCVYVCMCVCVCSTYVFMHVCLLGVHAQPCYCLDLAVCSCGSCAFVGFLDSTPLTSLCPWETLKKIHLIKGA